MRSVTVRVASPRARSGDPRERPWSAPPLPSRASQPARAAVRGLQPRHRPSALRAKVESTCAYDDEPGPFEALLSHVVVGVGARIAVVGTVVLAHQPGFLVQ